ncbi:hypothetical protein J6590_052338 [Homalodisca vitripennis]|nr:hypothetical protein J6590_052338 [Homalodisca vitripennis]
MTTILGGECCLTGPGTGRNEPVILLVPVPGIIKRWCKHVGATPRTLSRPEDDRTGAARRAVVLGAGSVEYTVRLAALPCKQTDTPTNIVTCSASLTFQQFNRSLLH